MTVSRRQLLGTMALLLGRNTRAPAAASPKPAPAPGGGDPAGGYRLRAAGMVVTVNRQGIISGALGQLAGRPLRFTAQTELHDCLKVSTTVSASAAGDRIEIRQDFRQRRGRRTCQVIERLRATPSSIRWELEIAAAGPAWSTGIRTRLAVNDVHDLQCWTAGDGGVGSEPGWRDPLKSWAFADQTLRFGGHVDDKRAFCLPLVSVLRADDDCGLSLIESPESALLDLELRTAAAGELVFSRWRHRIGGAGSLAFALDLVPHPADARAALGWLVARYPGYFDPPNPRAAELDGCGAYSGYQGALDAERLRAMAFSVNWNAHFDFPYQGMMIPPVDRQTSWTSWKQTPTSLARMDQYDRQMKGQGFHVLEYFVLTECGNTIAAAAPPRSIRDDDALWQDANQFVHYGIGAAVMRTAAGEIQYSDWFGNVVVDPAEPVWREQLLRQARRLVTELPACDGVCIDRLDWLSYYNARADDGSSWVDGHVARSLLNSWKDVGRAVANIFHAAGKCVFVNPLVRRLDTAAFIDGFYDEYADEPAVLNQCALLALRKPAIGWTRSSDTLKPDPDALFQRHLHVGVFPTVPFAEADHTIGPDPWAESYYLDYGPLLNAIRGKRWVLEAHVASTDVPTACINLFTVPQGYAAPITFAGEATAATVSLRLPELTGSASYTAYGLLPGAAQRSPLAGEWRGPELRVRVPLRRGCALLMVEVRTP